ncbi:MAG: dipicolinate synthase subunit B [Oscillospiraceae bacterium]|nr:dipicolinate synthase subunit B [Oscillospiraceae bacterium]
MTVGFAFTGSFCTFGTVFPVLEALTKKYEVVPIVSANTALIDSRFGSARDHWARITELCGRAPLSTIGEVEPIGPKKLLDALIVAPCTGNTLAKLAHSIADTPVTMAAKSHLRNGRPVILGVSTNDGLAGAAENIGRLMARKHYYFVPFGQDDPIGKPTSLVARFDQIPQALSAALEGRQVQPVLV